MLEKGDSISGIVSESSGGVELDIIKKKSFRNIQKSTMNSLEDNNMRSEE